MKILYYLMSLVAIVAIGSTLLFTSCKKEKDDDILNEQIAASKEMEDYIIAGYELSKATADFNSNKVGFNWKDFAFVKDESGREVMQLPSEFHFYFETVLQKFNDKKSKLQQKYPRVIGMAQGEVIEILKVCINESETVNTRLLEMDIFIFQPKTKQDGEDFGLNPFDRNSMIDSLSRLVISPNYTEAFYFGYPNGNFYIYVAPNSTDSSATMTLGRNNGYMYWTNGPMPTIPVEIFGHTHQNSTRPSGADYDVKNQFPNTTHTIFYDGRLNKF